jgi:hypothetical protein
MLGVFCPLPKNQKKPPKVSSIPFDDHWAKLEFSDFIIVESLNWPTNYDLTTMGTSSQSGSPYQYHYAFQIQNIVVKPSKKKT